MRTFVLTYATDGKQNLIENDYTYFSGIPTFKFISIWQKYSIFKESDLLLEIDFKNISNHYFSLRIDVQNFESVIELKPNGSLVDMRLNHNELIRLIPNEYVVNKNFLNITNNNVEIGKIYRRRLKIGTPIYTIDINESSNIDYILALCMVCLNKYE